MKILISLLLLIASLGQVAGFYDLSFTAVDGNNVSLSTLAGKKVILFPINGGHPDLAILRFIDSIGVQHQDSVAVMAFPALDMDSTVSDSSGVNERFTRLRDSLGLQLRIAQPSHVRKSAGAGQHSVFQWLTSLERNGHFGRDVEEEGQVFVVSRHGTLYSVINKNMVRRVLMDVIGTGVKE